MPDLLPFSPADFSETVRQASADAWQKTVDKTLRLALDDYNPALPQAHTLDECKALLRISDMGDGDVLVHWQPTDGLLGFFEHPRIETYSFPPKASMGRPTKDPERLKRPRTLSFTDAEYAKLGELAAAAKRGRSEYIIEQLGLGKQ